MRVVTVHRRRRCGAARQLAVQFARSTGIHNAPLPRVPSSLVSRIESSDGPGSTRYWERVGGRGGGDRVVVVAPAVVRAVALLVGGREQQSRQRLDVGEREQAIVEIVRK